MSTARTKIYVYPEAKPWLVKMLGKHMSSGHDMGVWNEWTLDAWNKLKIGPLDKEQAIRVLNRVYVSYRGQHLFYGKILPLVDPEVDVSRIIERENKLSKTIWDNRDSEWDKSPVLDDVVIGANHLWPVWNSSVQRFSGAEGVTGELSDCYDCLLVVRALEFFKGLHDRVVSISNYGRYAEW